MAAATAEGDEAGGLACKNQVLVWSAFGVGMVTRQGSRGIMGSAEEQGGAESCKRVLLGAAAAYGGGLGGGGDGGGGGEGGGGGGGDGGGMCGPGGLH